MLRNIELAFIRLHILYHSGKEEVFGMGLMEEIARHGYAIGPGTLYPILSKMEKEDLLSCRFRTVAHKQRKYYRITSQGKLLLEQMKVKIRELYTEVVEN